MGIVAVPSPKLTEPVTLSNNDRIAQQILPTKRPPDMAGAVARAEVGAALPRLHHKCLDCSCAPILATREDVAVGPADIFRLRPAGDAEIDQVLLGPRP